MYKRLLPIKYFTSVLKEEVQGVQCQRKYKNLRFFAFENWKLAKYYTNNDKEAKKSITPTAPTPPPPPNQTPPHPTPQPPPPKPTTKPKET